LKVQSIEKELTFVFTISSNETGNTTSLCNPVHPNRVAELPGSVPLVTRRLYRPLSGSNVSSMSNDGRSDPESIHTVKQVPKYLHDGTPTISCGLLFSNPSLSIILTVKQGILCQNENVVASQLCGGTTQQSPSNPPDVGAHQLNALALRQ
jgi:hypothetical protein